MRTPDADRARRAMVALCGEALDRRSFYEQATDALRDLVRFEGSCWHTIDPATLLITSHRTRNLPDPDRGFPALCANEYLADDLNKFAELASGARQTAVLSQVTGGHPEQSLRYREFLRPNGLEGELRSSFTDRGACWGSLILVRPPGSDFTERDVELVDSLTGLIARALRRTLLIDASRRTAAADETPGLVVVDGLDEIETLTAPAHHWLRLLGEPVASTADGWLPPTVHSVVNAVRRAVRSGDPASVRLTVQTMSGEWVELHGAVAEGGRAGRVAVILNGAAPEQVSPVLLSAAGLTARELEVVALVIQGLPTKVIAARLSLSFFTVQDHLRAIFEKLGVRSKQEVAAQVFFREQLPRIEAGAPIRANGTLGPGH